MIRGGESVFERVAGIGPERVAAGKLVPVRGRDRRRQRPTGDQDDAGGRDPAESLSALGAGSCLPRDAYQRFDPGEKFGPREIPVETDVPESRVRQHLPELFGVDRNRGISFRAIRGSSAPANRREVRKRTLRFASHSYFAGLTTVPSDAQIIAARSLLAQERS